jgi:FRG domain
MGPRRQLPHAEVLTMAIAPCVRQIGAETNCWSAYTFKPKLLRDREMVESPIRRIVIRALGPVRSLTEYVELSEKLIKKSGLKDSTTGLWWRGQANVEWRLAPSIYRGGIRPEYEREIIRDFRLKSPPFIHGPRPQTNAEWLFLMQHHRVPTRLLDWTESPLIALYFAVCDAIGDVEEKSEVSQRYAAVWILHPWTLNELTGYGRSIPTPSSEKIDSYIIDVDDPRLPRAPLAKLPIAIRLEYGFNRAHSQRGMATIHGSRKIPIEYVHNDVEAKMEFVSNTRRGSFLKLILIDGDSKYRIMKSLYEHGVSADILFPDLDGLSQALKFRYHHRYLNQTVP